MVFFKKLLNALHNINNTDGYLKIKFIIEILVFSRIPLTDVSAVT